MDARPKLSVVIPAYHEAARIPLTLIRTFEYLHKRHPDAEVIVVDDGSTDETSKMVRDIAAHEPHLKLLVQPRNRGKGAAVRRGMLESRGDYALFMDADLATPIEELDKLLVHARRGFDVVIGSRAMRQSEIRIQQPLPRRVMGRAFNLIVSSILLGGFKDTQCGFKLFSRAAADDLFARQTLDGFAFDVEILSLAKQRNYRVAEVPVVWEHGQHSKVSPVVDASKMFADLVRLRARDVAARVRNRKKQP